jgi:hypothetical protein
MSLWHVFLVRPFIAIAILVCPLAVLSCWSVLHKRAHKSFDRFLIGFVGLLSISQSIRLLRDCGLMTLPSNEQVNDALELLVAGFYFLATRTLRLSSDDRVGAGLALRLAKAAPPKVAQWIARRSKAETSQGLSSIMEVRKIIPHSNVPKAGPPE